MKSVFGLRSLSVQMITSFILVVLLSAVAIGLPAIWMLRNQLERQAWSQVEQGQRTAISLFAARYRAMQNLAILTAQRPTLQTLLAQDETLRLAEYLETLQNGAGVDLIEVCLAQQTVAATVSYWSACANPSITGYEVYGKIPPGETWMIARTPIEESRAAAEVVIGLRLDDGFAAMMGAEIGLEHFLCLQGVPVAASFSDVAAQANCPAENDDRTSHFSFEVDGAPYYAASMPLNENGLKAAVALDISEIATTQKRLALWMAAAILGVAAAGSGLGILLARRISHPLVQLSESAASFSQGNLESPVEIETRVREITQVAKTLESARGDLRTTLTSLQAERDWSGHLLASIVEGIITLDGETRITFFSHGAARITGWSEREVIGRPLDEVFHLAGADKPFSSVLSAISEGRLNVDALLAGERTASLAMTGAKLSRSGEKGTETALVFRDISEEEALHRLLGQFLANVAHEFRTPLAALEASIELLLDQAPDLNAAELHELHTSLHLGILGLHTLVDNLLESANIEARRFHVSPRDADLGNILAEAVRTMQPLLTKYEQRLTAELPVDIPTVRADARRTVQVLINLLSNASRYGPPGEEIILRVTVDSQWARVSVLDRGPGTPPEYRANLFRRFVFPQGNDAVSQAGAGLGLSVVKAIVTAHGGQVGVDDRPGGGSIFWFTLPIAGESS